MLTMRKRNGSQVSTKDLGTAQGESYKSPQRKLVRFFEQSRTQWKAKCRAAKATIKVLKNRIEFLEERKARWKGRAQALEAEVARLTASRQATSRAGHVLKKNGG
jgi:histidinol-phosphate/aromatic aminotransferase/cobyric acid decarboxylase-like protein